MPQNSPGGFKTVYSATYGDDWPASQSVSAGGTYTTEEVQTMDQADIEVVCEFVNGGTGPTVPLSGYIERTDAAASVAEGDADWIRDTDPVVTGPTGNNATRALSFIIPRTEWRTRLAWTGNTGQAVTLDAYAIRTNQSA